VGSAAAVVRSTIVAVAATAPTALSSAAATSPPAPAEAPTPAAAAGDRLRAPRCLKEASLWLLFFGILIRVYHALPLPLGGWLTGDALASTININNPGFESIDAQKMFYNNLSYVLNDN
jgi:hypothetical protein